MKCIICGGEYPSARRKGPYCSLRCGYESMRKKADGRGLRLKIDPKKLPKPRLEPTHDRRLLVREKLTGYEMQLLAELKMNNDSEEKRLAASRRGQAISAARRKNGGWQKNSWTPEEEKKILEMRQEGIRVNEIASALGRTPGAIRARFEVIHKREISRMAQ